MEIRLTEHLAKFVNSKVEEGGYEDASGGARSFLNFEAGGLPVKAATRKSNSPARNSAVRLEPHWMTSIGLPALA